MDICIQSKKGTNSKTHTERTFYRRQFFTHWNYLNSFSRLPSSGLLRKVKSALCFFILNLLFLILFLSSHYLCCLQLTHNYLEYTWHEIQKKKTLLRRKQLLQKQSQRYNGAFVPLRSISSLHSPSLTSAIPDTGPLQNANQATDLAERIYLFSRCFKLRCFSICSIQEV